MENKMTEKLNYYINEYAVVDNNVEIGEGTKVWHFSHIQSGSKIGKKCVFGQNVNVGNNVTVGDYCKIQNNVSIYEGVTLEDYVFCGPSMVFTNILNPKCKYPQVGAQFYIKTIVKEGASIGANATIVCGHTLGKHCMIGAGSVVTKDVPDYALVIGNPGRVVGWVSEAGKRLKFDKNGMAVCEKSKKNYEFKDEKVVEVSAIS
jgi:UDP-2-acetamido-3-amino-2,3-dideoxy-glucuronate N-acetyltransferase